MYINNAGHNEPCRHAQLAPIRLKNIIKFPTNGMPIKFPDMSLVNHILEMVDKSIEKDDSAPLVMWSLKAAIEFV